MKKIQVLIIFVLLISTVNIYSDDFRIGGVAGIGFASKPSTEDIIEAYDKRLDFFPGFFWEVLMDRFGFGMTNMFKFDKVDSDLPGIDNKWYINWMGSFDFRFHILDREHLDPFIEAGFGCAGSVDITNYGSEGYDRDIFADDMLLSLFAKIGGGLNVKFDNILIGGQLTYIFYNDVPPATNFDPYPLKNFEFTLMLGVILGNEYEDYDHSEDND